jgi:hypothetical protein
MTVMGIMTVTATWPMPSTITAGMDMTMSRMDTSNRPTTDMNMENRAITPSMDPGSMGTSMAENVPNMSMGQRGGTTTENTVTVMGSMVTTGTDGLTARMA